MLTTCFYNFFWFYRCCFFCSWSWNEYSSFQSILYLQINMYVYLKCWNYRNCNVECIKGYKFPDGSGITNIGCVDGQWQHTKTGQSVVPDCEREYPSQISSYIEFMFSFMLQPFATHHVKTVELVSDSMYANVLRSIRARDVNMVMFSFMNYSLELGSALCSNEWVARKICLLKSALLLKISGTIYMSCKKL